MRTCFPNCGDLCLALQNVTKRVVSFFSKSLFKIEKHISMKLWICKPKYTIIRNEVPFPRKHYDTLCEIAEDMSD